METLYRFRWQVALLLVGLLISGAGIFMSSRENLQEEKVEILSAQDSAASEIIIIEISGAVQKPGVYELPQGSRVADLLKLAGGIKESADNLWVSKYINQAAKLEDGQKIFIPTLGEQSDTSSANKTPGESGASATVGTNTSGLININTATQQELESLWGIGPVYAQKIVEHRPYSSVEELISKDIIKQNVYDKNKDILTVY